MSKENRQNQWAKIELAIQRLNDRSRFRKENPYLDKIIQKYEELDAEERTEQV